MGSRIFSKENVCDKVHSCSEFYFDNIRKQSHILDIKMRRYDILAKTPTIEH